MSEEAAAEKAEKSSNRAVQLDGLFAFKLGMSTVFDESGESVPVTVLKYEPWVVSQLKTKDTDGYEAIQIACRPNRAKNTSQAQTGHLKKAGFENGAIIVREMRQSIPEGTEVGQKIDMNSLKKGDTVKVTSVSRGRGFSGVVRRWSFAGGPASHGSGFHRKPGSIGNRTWPGRVIPGKRMAGQYGNEKVTVSNLKIVDVMPEENVLLVRGAVPGSRNTLVKLMKV